MSRGALILLAGLTAAVASANDALDRAAETLANIEARVAQLERETTNPVAKSAFYPIEKRLLDAELNFELENYAKAAVLYLDARQNAAFPTHPDRLQILANLGTSLFKIRNFLGAKDTFEELVRAGHSPLYDLALRSLVEIALSTRSGTGLAEVLAKLGALATRGPGSQYAYGKGLVRIGRSLDGAAALAAVTPGAPEYVSAQYYLGVALVELARYPDARVAFTNVTVAAEGKDALQPQLELARLALGRLLLELGQWDAAASEYAEIGRTSPHYHNALYEMTWAYVNADQLEKAANALDLLLLTVEDDRIATEAHILRGRLNTQLDRSDSAAEAYAEVLLRFRPLREELDIFSRDKNAMRNYFRWLLGRHDDAVRLQAGLSERAMAWIQHDAELRVLVGLFDDLSLQRTELAEARGLLEELDAALADGARIDAFPNLRSAWTRIVIARNELTEVSTRSIEARAAATPAHLATVLAQARALRSELGGAPTTAQAYEASKDSSRSQLAELRREAFHLSQQTRSMREELKAVEAWLADGRYRDGGISGGEKEVAARLAAARTRYEALNSRLGAAEVRIAREEARVGAGDRTERAHEALRARLLQLHSQLDRGIEGPDAAAARQLRSGLVSALQRLDRVASQIEAAAQDRSGEYQSQVEAERKLIDGYARTIAAFDQDTDRLSRDVGAPLFQAAKVRLDDIVLEADIGVVDIAYKRKQRESERIATLQKERGDALQAIENTMETLRRAEP